MKPSVLLFCWVILAVAGCSWIPRAGPSTSDVLEQGRAGGEILFDVVQVDDRVVSTLLGQPKESFARRFKENAQPPEVKIAIGDTISVVIWESAAGGLFSEAPPAPVPTGGRSETEPLAPQSQPPAGGQPSEFGAPNPSTGPLTETARPPEGSGRAAPSLRSNLFRSRGLQLPAGGGRPPYPTSRSEPMVPSAFLTPGGSRQLANSRPKCSRRSRRD